MTSDSITRNCAAIVFMAASLGLLFSRPVAARADEVTYSISGTVSGAITDESTNHYVPTSIVDGSTFTGTISFDKSASGTINVGNAQYRGADLNLAVDILIAGQYEYVNTTPSNSDEIDLSSSGTPRFGFYKRGPIVPTGFSPFPPFSHLDFFGGSTSTDILSDIQLSGGGFTSGVGDTEDRNDPYYYVSANITSVQQVPEPGTVALLLVAAGTFTAREWRRQIARCLGSALLETSRIGPSSPSSLAGALALTHCGGFGIDSPS